MLTIATGLKGRAVSVVVLTFLVLAMAGFVTIQIHVLLVGLAMTIGCPTFAMMVVVRATLGISTRNGTIGQHPFGVLLALTIGRPKRTMSARLEKRKGPLLFQMLTFKPC